MPERPIECSGCKKEIQVLYTEIVGNTLTRSAMCSDCPAYQRHMRGTPAKGEQLSEKNTEMYAGLACGNCNTTLETLRTGNPLGCSECYAVFADPILTELQSSGKAASPPKNFKAVHIGRGPGETIEINPSSRLLALNEALNETLAREDYEQAAWLRDQIKELTEKSNDTSGQSGQESGE